MPPKKKETSTEPVPQEEEHPSFVLESIDEDVESDMEQEEDNQCEMLLENGGGMGGGQLTG